MSALQSFGFGDQLVRVIERSGIAWFVANDVCSVLEIANPRDAVSRLEEDEKGVGNTDTRGGSQELTIISESGVFALIFRSRKPAAKTFRKWVTAEVLPTIRKTGRFDLLDGPSIDDPVPMQRLPETPDEFEQLRARLQLVREARIAFGAAGARRAWSWAGLPDVSDQSARLPWHDPCLADRYPAIAEWMRERVEIAPGGRVPARALYRDYQEWTFTRGSQPSDIHSETALGRFLSEAGVQSLRSNSMWRLGIRLKG